MSKNDPVIVECNRLLEEGRTAEALHALKVHGSSILNMLGLLYLEKFKDPNKSLEFLDMAEKVDRSSWIIQSNKSHVLCQGENYHEALKSANKAVHLSEGEQQDAIFNCAVINGFCHNIRESIELYKQAESLDESNLNIRFNLANALLMDGQYSEGWWRYDSRMEREGDSMKVSSRYSQPIWEGEPFDGTLGVFSEQGVGDLIQFARYLPLARERVSNLVVECQRGVERLFGPEFKTRGPSPEFGPPIECDRVISINSLGRIFNCEGQDFQSSPYIKPVSKFKVPKARGKNKKIGIVWCGNPSHANDNWRSCHLKWFVPLSKIPGVRLYSLQRTEDQIRTWAGKKVNLLEGANEIQAEDLGNEFKDFADTAAAIDQLDLVVSVDTAVAHLSAAMGKPTWIALSYINDWRWGVGTDKSPWYPSARLFRQESLGSWDQVFSDITAELQRG